MTRRCRDSDSRRGTKVKLGSRENRQKVTSLETAHVVRKMATEAVPMQTTSPDYAAKSRRDKALEDYRKRLIDHKEQDDKLKKSKAV